MEIGKQIIRIESIGRDFSLVWRVTKQYHLHSSDNHHYLIGIPKQERNLYQTLKGGPL